MWNLDRDTHRKASIARHRIDRHLPMHAGNDAIDEVEPQAGAFPHAFGGKKRLKDARLHIRWDAGTIVGDLDEDEIVLASGSDAQLAIFSHGVGSIVDQVGPNLI